MLVLLAGSGVINKTTRLTGAPRHFPAYGGGEEKGGVFFKPRDLQEYVCTLGRRGGGGARRETGGELLRTGRGISTPVPDLQYSTR